MTNKLIQTKGKRKRAVVRATLSPGKGIIKINGINLNNFSTDILRHRISEPLLLAEEIAKKVDFNITVNGGGVNGQADAIRLAIARALVEHEPKLKKTFDSYDRLLLVADIRRKEACKPNDSKARAKRQKSYR
ncbi:MAG: 30S ribosomal protein S9 [Nanoarchaeota archaeon]|nr:30S ribosomal protein S9 [Nanoarchaeota archaeon]MBU1644139.1 30S ribosomal protein S9 [Nanoarchaeota archaeon]MBU1976803.1 30S ribosomal protein S9 [Nanoarchaeota archaeon]